MRSFALEDWISSRSFSVILGNTGEFGTKEGEKALDNISGIGIVAPGSKTTHIVNQFVTGAACMRSIRGAALSMFGFKIACNGL